MGNSGKRLSNIELLRVIAMLFVLTVHADFWAIGAPTAEEMASAPVASGTRILFQSLAIGCVDIFILISGWFGIKVSKKGFLKFIYLCLFFLVGIYAFCVTVGHSRISVEGIRGCLLLLPINWFIKSYLLLYILSPVLNSFCESATKKTFSLVLLGFYTFQTIYGVTNSVNFFEEGYSTISFIGLYLLARYIRLHTPSWSQYKRPVYLFAYLLVSFSMVFVGMKLSSIAGLFFTYISPTTIIASVCLLLYFSKLHINYNKAINFLGASSFAVFLLHSNPNVNESVFKCNIQQLYASYDSICSIFAIGAYLIGVYLLAVLIDQFRILSWNCILKLTSKKKNPQ